MQIIKISRIGVPIFNPAFYRSETAGHFSSAISKSTPTISNNRLFYIILNTKQLSFSPAPQTRSYGICGSELFCRDTASAIVFVAGKDRRIHAAQQKTRLPCLTSNYLHYQKCQNSPLSNLQPLWQAAGNRSKRSRSERTFSTITQTFGLCRLNAASVVQRLLRYGNASSPGFGTASV